MSRLGYQSPASRFGRFLIVLTLTIILISGVFIFLGGCWLMWDLVNFATIAPPNTTPNWQFCYPFFWFNCVNNTQWTLPFDIGLAMAIMGFVISVIGAVSVGYILRPRSSM